MKNTNLPIRIVGTSISSALLALISASTAHAALLIRVDLGGNGSPANGFVEYKASSTLVQRIADDTDRNGVGVVNGTGDQITETQNPGGAWFGSTGSNIWDARDITNGVPVTFSGLLDTATGAATGVSLAINNANRSNDGLQGDWRGFVDGLNKISAGGIEAASSAGMDWTITGLAPNTTIELWIYANDKNYNGTAYTVNGVNLVDPPRYGGNWTKRDEASPFNGFGWGMTVTTDGSGTLTGWAKQSSEIRGLQIYQAIPEPTSAISLLGGLGLLFVRRRRA
jgi:hypothetical protein